MDISLIINRLKIYLNIESDTDLAKYLGIKTNTLANWKKRNSFDIEILFTKCEFVFADWFINGDFKKSEECNEVEILKTKISEMEKLLNEKERTIQILMGNIRESRVTG